MGVTQFTSEGVQALSEAEICLLPASYKSFS